MNSNQVAKYRFKLRVWQFGLLAAIFFVWWALTKPGLIPAFVFDNDNQAAFFFGEPLVIFREFGIGLSSTLTFMRTCGRHLLKRFSRLPSVR